MCIEQQVADFIGVDINFIREIWVEDHRKYLSIDSVKGNKGEKRRRSRSCKDIWKSYNNLKSLNRKQTNERWSALPKETIELFTSLAGCEKKLLEYCRTGVTKQQKQTKEPAEKGHSYNVCNGWFCGKCKQQYNYTVDHTCFWCGFHYLLEDSNTPNPIHSSICLPKKKLTS